MSFATHDLIIITLHGVSLTYHNSFLFEFIQLLDQYQTISFLMSYITILMINQNLLYNRFIIVN